jgi:hypothetical protein
MFHIPMHAEPHIPVEAHSHPDTPKADQAVRPRPRPPVSITPDLDFSAHAASGQPSGLLARLPVSDPGFVRVMLPGDASTYYIKNDAGKGTHQLYTRDPSSGTYIQTYKRVALRGKDGWQRDDGLKGGLPLTPAQRGERLRNAQTACRQAATELAILQDAVTEARSKYQTAPDAISRQIAHEDLIAAVNAHSAAATLFRDAQQELTNALAT